MGNKSDDQIEIIDSPIPNDLEKSDNEIEIEE